MTTVRQQHNSTTGMRDHIKGGWLTDISHVLMPIVVGHGTTMINRCTTMCNCT